MEFQGLYPFFLPGYRSGHPRQGIGLGIPSIGQPHGQDVMGDAGILLQGPDQFDRLHPQAKATTHQLVQEDPFISIQLIPGQFDTLLLFLFCRSTPGNARSHPLGKRDLLSRTRGW